MLNVCTTTNATGDSQEQWRTQLQAEILASENRFRGSKNQWNRWYYGFLAGGIGLPALSFLVLKLDRLTDVALKNDIAAILAALGAVATSLMAVFNFRKRWALSRTARIELHQLKVDVLKPDADLELIAQRLKSSLVKYNEGTIEE